MIERPVPLRAGVLGGMGPEATLVFLEKFYSLSRGRREQERPPLLIDIEPAVPDRNEAWRGRGTSPAAAISAMGRRLKRAGADFCVMPCVTAHGFAGDFERDAGLPLLSLPEVVADALAETVKVPIGLLATTTTLEMKLFQDPLARRSIPFLLPERTEQENLMRAIYAVKHGGEPNRAVGEACESVARRGARKLLIGCTDLSALPPPRIEGCTVIDALDLLAVRTLAAIETPIRPDSDAEA